MNKSTIETTTSEQPLRQIRTIMHCLEWYEKWNSSNKISIMDFDIKGLSETFPDLTIGHAIASPLTLRLGSIHETMRFLMDEVLPKIYEPYGGIMVQLELRPFEETVVPSERYKNGWVSGSISWNRMDMGCTNHLITNEGSLQESNLPVIEVLWYLVHYVDDVLQMNGDSDHKFLVVPGVIARPSDNHGKGHALICGWENIQKWVALSAVGIDCIRGDERFATPCFV